MEFSDVVGSPEFELSARQVGPDVLVVELSGELDLVTAPQASIFLTESLSAKPAHLVLDLSGLTFMAAHGIVFLLDVQERTAAAECSLHIVGVKGNRAVARPLELMALLDRFDVESDLAAVLAGIDERRQ